MLAFASVAVVQLTQKKRSDEDDDMMTKLLLLLENVCLM